MTQITPPRRVGSNASSLLPPLDTGGALYLLVSFRSHRSGVALSSCRCWPGSPSPLSAFRCSFSRCSCVSTRPRTIWRTAPSHDPPLPFDESVPNPGWPRVKAR